MLLESIKPQLTKQLIIDLDARHLNENMVQFLERNVKKHPGKVGPEIQYAGIQNKC